MIIISKWWCNLFVIKGCCWFPGIAIVRRADDYKTIRNEKVHVRQHLEGLYFGWLLLYLYFTITRGYYDNPFEIDSRTWDDSDELLKQRPAYAWTKYI